MHARKISVSPIDWRASRRFVQCQKKWDF